LFCEKSIKSFKTFQVYFFKCFTNRILYYSRRDTCVCYSNAVELYISRVSTSSVCWSTL